MTREINPARELYSFTRALNDATEKNNGDAIKKALTRIEEITTQNMSLFFEKIPLSTLFHPLNSLFFVIKALHESILIQNKIAIEKIIALLEKIIEENHSNLVIQYFFEQSPCILGPQSQILRLLILSTEKTAVVQYRILYKLLQILGMQLVKNHDAREVTIITESQPLLQKILKNYIEENSDLQKLTTITDEKTLLGALIDYHADALSAFEVYSVRGFVKNHIARLVAHETLKMRITETNSLNHLP